MKQMLTSLNRDLLQCIVRYLEDDDYIALYHSSSILRQALSSKSLLSTLFRDRIQAHYTLADLRRGLEFIVTQSSTFYFQGKYLRNHFKWADGVILLDIFDYPYTLDEDNGLCPLEIDYPVQAFGLCRDQCVLLDFRKKLFVCDLGRIDDVDSVKFMEKTVVFLKHNQWYYIAPKKAKSIEFFLPVEEIKDFSFDLDDKGEYHVHHILTHDGMLISDNKIVSYDVREIIHYGRYWSNPRYMYYVTTDRILHFYERNRQGSHVTIDDFLEFIPSNGKKFYLTQEHKVVELPIVPDDIRNSALLRYEPVINSPTYGVGINVYYIDLQTEDDKPIWVVKRISYPHGWARFDRAVKQLFVNQGSRDVLDYYLALH